MAIDRKTDRKTGLSQEKRHQLAFEFFNEVGIIQQLATTMFNRQLPDGLLVSHFSVLNHLVRVGEGQTPLELARAFQVTKGTMTNTLSVLSERSLIRTEPHDSDRRSKRVFLTDKGREFQKRAIESLAPLVEKYDGLLDFAKMAEILPTLREVRETLDENRLDP